MNSRHHRWLAEQLPAWERDGILSADGARRLRERYGAEPSVGLAQMVVGAVGALLIGTGLIAVLAYNWDDFPRWVRLGLALGPLAASQAVSWWVLGRGDAAKPWHREAAALVQTLAAGAAMALVSQIYNLPGTWTDLVFWWCAVAVPLAWVMKSQAVAIAYLVGITVWTGSQAVQANVFSAREVADVRIWFPLLLAGVLPLWPGADGRERPAPVPLVAAPLSAADASGWPVAITYSLVLLVTAIVLIALEFLGRQGAARIGAALITILVILRMADADLSLLTKGLAFIVIGTGFLAFNSFVSRRRTAAPGGAPA